MTKTTDRYVPVSFYAPKPVQKRLVAAAKQAGDYISKFTLKLVEQGLDAIEQKKAK